MNDNILKNDADIIIVITWLKLKSLLESKEVLYQVSSDLGEVNSFYNSFSNMGQKAPPAFQKFKKPCLV